MRFTIILLVEIISTKASEIFDCALSKFPEANISSSTHCAQCSTVGEPLPGCFFDSVIKQCFTCKIVCWGKITFGSQAYNRCRRHCPDHLEKYCQILNLTTEVHTSKSTTTADCSTNKPPMIETSAKLFTETTKTTAKHYTDRPFNNKTRDKFFSELTSENETIVKNFTERPEESETATVKFHYGEQTAKEYARENYSNYGLVAGTVLGCVLFLAVLTSSIMLLCCCCCERCSYYEPLKGVRRPITQNKEFYRANNRKRFELAPPPTPSKISSEPSLFYTMHKNHLPHKKEQKLNPLYHMHKKLPDIGQEPKLNPLYDLPNSLLTKKHEHKKNLLYDIEEGLIARRQDHNHNKENYEDWSCSRYSTHIYAEIPDIRDESCYEVPNGQEACK